MKSERELWSAVLGQAIEDLTDSRAGSEGYSARLWFESDNHEPGSFLWICDHLELEASSIRRGVLERPSTSGRLRLTG